MKKKLRYVCCQPSTLYYAWQVEVMINNFVEMGVDPSQINIISSIENVIPQNWLKLKNHYTEVNFFFYKDTRENFSYIPSIYFNLMKQFIQSDDSIKDDILFLHDCDILFTRLIDFGDMLSDDTWYLSDTVSYIGYNYIKSKGIDLYYNPMCEIIGIDAEVPKLNQPHSGGAQYLVKNTTYEFWDKVEKDSIQLYKYFCDVERDYVKKHDSDYPIQKWTAGMWSLLWNAWLFNHKTIVDQRLNFAWVTDPIIMIDRKDILHNAGVTPSNMKSDNLFYKGNYINKIPYKESLKINPNKCSSYYWDWIQKTSIKSVLL